MYQKLTTKDYKALTKKLTKQVITEPPKKKKLTLKQIFF